MDALYDGIAVIEKLANGGHVLDNGAPAYWEDAEAFFRRASWDLLFDQEAAQHPWELSYDPELPPPPPRPDIW